jgi:hypothetical protein
LKYENKKKERFSTTTLYTYIPPSMPLNPFTMIHKETGGKSEHELNTSWSGRNMRPVLLAHHDDANVEHAADEQPEQVYHKNNLLFLACLQILQMGTRTSAILGGVGFGR